MLLKYFGTCSKSGYLAVGAALFASALSLSSAYAADRTIQIPERPLSGYSTAVPIDILGVTIGMAQPDALNWVRSRFNTYREDKRAFSRSVNLRDKKFTVETSQFLAAVYGEKTERSVKEKVEMDFALPASGGGVLSMLRDLTFGKLDDQPTIESFQKALVAKYGTPTHTFVADDRTIYCWRYKDAQPLSSEECGKYRTDLLQDDDYNTELINSGVTSMIYAKMNNSGYDAKRIEFARILFLDVAKYASDMSAAEKNLKSVLDAVQAEDSARAPGSVPNF